MLTYLLSLSLVLVSFSKSSFFETIKTKNKVEIAALEKEIGNQKIDNTQQAYLGTIKMTSSDFEKTPAEKLKKFKEGKALLEKSISAEPTNPEFRFLRLIIQENAPKMLKYNQNIAEDAKFIQQNSSKLPKEVKTAATNYSKTSSNLHL